MEQHKNKNITIISATEKLVTKDFDDKFQNTIRNFIEQNNVKVSNNIYDKNHNNKNNNRSKLEKLPIWRAWRKTKSYSRPLKWMKRRLKLIL